jgi:DNA primase
MLPFLRGHPIAMIRFPDGSVQKNARPGLSEVSRT